MASYLHGSIGLNTNPFFKDLWEKKKELMNKEGAASNYFIKSLPNHKAICSLFPPSPRQKNGKEMFPYHNLFFVCLYWGFIRHFSTQTIEEKRKIPGKKETKWYLK